MNNLIDTIELMKSDDFKQRFKAEYYQLKIRKEKLSNIIDHFDDGSLDFQPDSPQHLLRMQLKAMENYLSVLESRAKFEEIQL